MPQKSNSTKYFFILGNSPALSLVEIFGLFNLDSKDNYVKIMTFCKDFLIVETDIKIDSNKLMGSLGGTIKIGIILESQNVNIDARDLIEEINIDKNKKFYFGFSAYGKIGINFKRLAMNIKNKLKEEGVSSRWVISREKQLSSVVVKKNRLVDCNGAEWCAMRNEDKIFWGRTLAVQEFEDYSKRDFERPKRDSKSGMLPPKLAKMMINLARAGLWTSHLETALNNPRPNPPQAEGERVPPPLERVRGRVKAKILVRSRDDSFIDYKTMDDVTLLDPFCGSGTILQEAAILGMDKLIGSDLSEKAVHDSLQNLKWLEEYKKLKTDLSYRNFNNQLSCQQTPQPPLSGGLAQFPPDKGGKGGFNGNEIKIKTNKYAVGLNLEIFHCDVRKISELISENSVDLIVTEPYLGPPLTGSEGENRINQIVQELSELYLSAFGEFKKILKKTGCVCMVWPVFSVCGKNIFLPIFDKVKTMGFKQVGFEENNYRNLIFDNSCKLQFENKNLIPATQSSGERLLRSACDGKLKNFKKNLADNFSENGNIIYGREGQMVKREIMIFKL